MAENIRDIVNGSQLPGHIGKNISIIGLVNDVRVGDSTFKLLSTDNITVPVTLKNPISYLISGYVEVHGVSQGRTVLADTLIQFGNEQFDAKSHNALCKLLYVVPNLFKN